MSDFTEENGATRVVVGSNLREDKLSFGPDDTQPAEMARGSVLFYSGSVYHGGGANRSDTTRIGLNITYNVAWLRQEENQYLSVPREVAETLPTELLRLMGYDRGAYALGYIDDLRDPDRGGATRFGLDRLRRRRAVVARGRDRSPCDRSVRARGTTTVVACRWTSERPRRTTTTSCSWRSAASWVPARGSRSSRHCAREDFDDYWVAHSSALLVARFEGTLIGAYYIKPNFVGRAAHIANAGYFVLAPYRGTGVGRTLVEHSLHEARRLGFDAMIFNLVFESNPARSMYERLGFKEVGRIPAAIDGEDARDLLAQPDGHGVVSGRRRHGGATRRARRGRVPAPAPEQLLRHRPD